jgi:hypothetical protein
MRKLSLYVFCQAYSLKGKKEFTYQSVENTASHLPPEERLELLSVDRVDTDLSIC